MPDQEQTLEEAWQEYAEYAKRLGLEPVESYRPSPHFLSTATRRRPLGELMSLVHERLPEGMTPQQYFDVGPQPTYRVEVWDGVRWNDASGEIYSRTLIERLREDLRAGDDRPYRIVETHEKVVG